LPEGACLIVATLQAKKQIKRCQEDTAAPWFCWDTSTQQNKLWNFCVVQEETEMLLIPKPPENY